MADNFGLKIGLEGEKEFKKALADINQSFKVLGSEMKVVQSQFDKNDDSVEALTARNQVLGKEIDAQKKKIETLRQALEKFKAEASLGEARQVMASAKTVGGLHVITGTRQNLDANALRAMGDFMRDKDPSVVAVLASINGEKVSFLLVAVSNTSCCTESSIYSPRKYSI